MPRFVTPHGVEIEMSEQAARNVGYKPVKAKPEPRRAKKKDSEHSSESDD